MANGYSAAVFNQSEADFMHAAEAIVLNSPVSIENLHLFLRTHAIGLNNFIAHYLEDIVEPLNTDAETGEISEIEQRSPGAFRAGALTTFKMVHMVSKETGTALPSLVADLGRVPVDEVSAEYDLNAPIINHFYRGMELRDRFPHLYDPVVRLMHLVSEGPSVEVLKADLATPIYSHRNTDTAFLELHFIGGAAETVLAIEDRAAP
jgi:hypothetical protein